MAIWSVPLHTMAEAMMYIFYKIEQQKESVWVHGKYILNQVHS